MSLCERHFVNRGFLYGPLCPIYGAGVLLFTFLCAPAGGNYALVFMISLVACSALEYLTGTLLELIFHCKWWDYSSFPLNLKGRIFLPFCILWGVFGLVVVAVVNPLLVPLLRSVTSHSWGKALATGLLLYLLCDTAATLKRLIEFKKLLSQLESILAELREKLSAVRVSAAEPILTRLPKNVRLPKPGISEIPPLSALAKLRLTETLLSGLTKLSGEQPELVSAELKARLEQALNRITPKFKSMFRHYPHFDSGRIRDALAEIRSRLRV